MPMKTGRSGQKNQKKGAMRVGAGSVKKAGKSKSPSKRKQTEGKGKSTMKLVHSKASPKRTFAVL